MIKKILACLSLSLAAGPATAAFIDFEGFVDGTSITDQFDGVEFSSADGRTNLITNQPGIGFGNGFICTGTSSIDCTGETILTFSSGVSDLSFYQVGDNNTGVVALVDVFVGGLFEATVDILGFNTFNTPDLVDLTAYSNVTSIRIHGITDGGGLGWDDFSFEEAMSEVPLPAGGMLLLTGLGALAFSRRRKRD